MTGPSTSYHAESTGSWVIDLGPPTETTPPALNRLAREMSAAFAQSFARICRADEARFDLLTIDDHGRPWRVSEGEHITLSGSDAESIWANLATAVADPAHTYFTRIVLACSVRASLADENGRPGHQWIPHGAEFYFGYVLENDAADRLTPVDAGVAFTTHVDVWVPRRREPSFEWADNRTNARANKPDLQDALQRWEKATGKPITEYSSRYYSTQIFRYGFRDEVEQ
jgi:hypothetical protein